MSDELSANVTVRRRKVMRLDGMYHIAMLTEEAGWIVDGRGYPHSTSAYAKLGRIVSQEMQQ